MIFQATPLRSDLGEESSFRVHCSAEIRQEDKGAAGSKSHSTMHTGTHNYLIKCLLIRNS